MFKQAAKLKLRFQTHKGMLSVEDLYDLKLTDLDKIAVALDEELAKTPRKSFIAEINPEDSITTLKFNIVKDVIADKLKETAARQADKEKRAKKARLEELLAKKQEAKFEEMSEEELKIELAKL